jgi:hypothetical protein
MWKNFGATSDGGRRFVWRFSEAPEAVETRPDNMCHPTSAKEVRLSNSFGYHARAPSRSALIAQDAQALEAIRVRDQPDDLKQHIPLETGGKASGEFLKTADSGPSP